MPDTFESLKAALSDSYDLEKEIGQGGMATVYLARDIKHDRKVAVKVLRPELSQALGSERFLREVKIAAQLEHPNILTLIDSGEADGFLYFVMPFVQGESLRDKLNREGELPIGEVVRILRDVADALEFAHGQGVVHRDVKPDNVMLSGRHALVTDFGIAKAVSESTGAQAMTSMGVALGTPAYMAPEQASADPHVDHRADIYALGAMAYEMFSGNPPFTGATPQAVLTAHVTQAPEPVNKYRPAVPQHLTDLVMRCLEKHAADRWQNAGEILSVLDAFTTSSGGITPTDTAPISAITPGLLHAHNLRTAGLFGMAAVAALGAVYFLMIQLGLPDWVIWGAVLLLLVGFPIMIFTGHVEKKREITRLTQAVTSTGDQGVRRWFTWRRAVLGGGFSFAGLGLISVVYMLMRAMGIGPAGTLMTTGVLEDQSRILVADFENRTNDSALGPSVTEALRIDLAQSPVIRLMDGSAVTRVLQRMERDVDVEYTVPLMTEVAEREGVSALIAGEVAPLGAGFVLSTRLVSVGDGDVLLALRETADDESEIIGAVDRLSAKLRERIGESLRTIRANEPLERVTTGSVAALRSYSRGIRAFNAGEFERARALLEDAIELDTLFAMAYRKLSVTLIRVGSEADIVAAATKAFELRDRLPELERYVAVGSYYQQAEEDPQRAIAAYQAALEIDPNQYVALMNLSGELRVQRRWDEAEELVRRAVEVHGAPSSYFGLVFTLLPQRKLREIQEVTDLFAEAHPEVPQLLVTRAALAAAERDYDAAMDYWRQLVEQHRDLTWQRWGTAAQAAIASIRGRLGESERQWRSYAALAEQYGLAGRAMDGWLATADLDLLRDSPDDAVASIEDVLSRYDLDSLEAVDRPYLFLASLYAQAGRLVEARRWLDVYREELEERLQVAPDIRETEGEIALAEGQYADVVTAFREYNERSCYSCGLYELGESYYRGGELDSAVAVFERAANTSSSFSVFSEARWLARSYLRLAELHENSGNRDSAADYYNRFIGLWDNADAELQPTVADARERLARLVQEEGL